PDGAPGMISPGGFDNTSDYGTTCGSMHPADNWTDWVFHFRLTEPRDVTLNMLGAPSGRMQLQSTCGTGATAIGGCVPATGGGLTRRFRGLTAGDYCVGGENNGMISSPIILIVTTTALGVRIPGDVCTGAPSVMPDGAPVI